MAIMATGRKTVTAVGLPERLVDIVQGHAGRLDITALSTNTGSIYVGGRDVSGVSGSENGWRLDTVSGVGDMLTFINQQIYDVWIDATVAGEGIHWGAHDNGQ